MKACRGSSTETGARQSHQVSSHVDPISLLGLVKIMENNRDEKWRLPLQWYVAMQWA